MSGGGTVSTANMRAIEMVTIPERQPDGPTLRAVAIRPAATADASSIADLLGQLGYPATSEAVTARLGALSGHDGAVVLVADVNGTVMGVASAHAFPALHSSMPAAWLTAMVVGEAYRGLGIGRLLVDAIEHWAARRRATRLSLTSALHRTAAHAFYARLGYQHTGVRLAKNLG